MRDLTTTLDTAVRDALAYLRTTDMDAAADLAELRRLQLTRPGIVVVGETKRGKSSLVNALLGVPGLSPVDVAVTTAAYLGFVPGDTMTARAWLPEGGEPVPVDDLAGWARGEHRARRIEITHPAPLLRYLSLLDTPGAGGLDPAHATIALDAVRRGTALLFVADASAPLSKPELDFLARAAERVDAVVFTLTKIDAYPQWRRIAEDNQALLHAHAARFAAAPWYPVSARLAELALTTTDPARQTALADASKIPGLQHALIELAGRGHQLQLANVLRAARAELGRLHTLAEAKVQAATADPARQAQLRADRAELAARKRTESRQWTLLLGAEVQRARVEAIGQLRARIADLQQDTAARIDTLRGDQLTRLPDDLDVHLQAVAAHLSEHLETTFGHIAATVLDNAFDPGDRDTVLGKVNATLRHTLAAAAPRDGSGDNMLIALSAGGIAFMAGRGAALGISVLGAAGGLLVPVAGLGLGLAAGGYVLYRRRVHSDRQHARTWLRDVLAEARAALADEITVRFTDLQYALSVALDDATGRRLKDLDAQIADLDAAAAEDASGRAARRAAAQQELDTVRVRVRQADEALLRARALTPAPIDDER
ncbi:F0F1-type ATP synthase membrane subunit b/b' [Actinoplanes octamycinicus]|uniref:F0F1-type ATP synthase membrane subunit b/b n=1 Tax=Actinoplanes octamycinicus TaxID=135948 RepID=A0A7W7H293_9ACTN|nr:dynamin family protein [Actinoplanes octamycinicus]MBB4742568.1 F0F1-type ATP synthase membrane subunit b/b' [Actinoplanes octamycinicus]GIE60906.1 dynamin [Actinoplanes octamycinicus]